MDHIIYKSTAYRAILNENSQLAETFGDEHECKFGRWYDSDGKEMFGHTNAFKAIAEPHKRVHDIVLQTVPCASKGVCLTPEKRENIVRNLNQMEQESARMFSLIREMIQEANPEVQL